jgi:hypothetical protein
LSTGRIVLDVDQLERAVEGSAQRVACEAFLDGVRIGVRALYRHLETTGQLTSGGRVRIARRDSEDAR